MQFWPEDPARKTRVQWYFCAPEATALPYATPFASRTWEIKEPPLPTLGEALTPRLWRGGQPPYPVRFGGLCGSYTQWTFGLSPDDPVPESWPGTQVPTCCSKPPDQAVGGIAWGGECVVGAGIVTPCCPSGTVPASLTATVVATAGGCSCWSGFSTTLTYNPSSTFWEGTALDPCGSMIPFNVRLSCNFTFPFFFWEFLVEVASIQNVFHDALITSWTCAPFGLTTHAMVCQFTVTCAGDGAGTTTWAVGP